MNNVIQGTVRELEPRYKDRSDNEIIMDIRIGNHSGEALFFLLFGRYTEMLQMIFSQQAKPSMEFDDFMLELDIRLFTGRCGAFFSFDESKASFKTYLSKIAHNLLYDMKAKEMPMLDIETLQYSVSGVDAYEMFALVDAINTYPNKDSRYVLLKTIEGYKSKEIAVMLTSCRHEEGSLEEEKELKSSYIDTLRSRALKAIRNRISCPENNICESKERTSEHFDLDIDSLMLERKMAEPEGVAISRMDKANIFVKNICDLYNQMMEV